MHQSIFKDKLLNTKTCKRDCMTALRFWVVFFLNKTINILQIKRNETFFFCAILYKRRKHLKEHCIHRCCLQHVFGYVRVLCNSGVGGIRSADTRRMDRNQTYWPLPQASRIICMLTFLISNQFNHIRDIFMLKLLRICFQCDSYKYWILLMYIY